MDTVRYTTQFDLIVVGAGHAGCEAALAAARMGLSVLLLTSSVDRIGHTSCNPAIGGPAKSHIVFEIDALGGSMGIWADTAAIQVRRLNATKGPAVQATRAQIDRLVYRAAVQKDIFSQPNLHVAQGTVEELLIKNNTVHGVRTDFGQEYAAPNILLTAGTFVDGCIYIGDMQMPGGRIGDTAAKNLSKNLQHLGVQTERFMTCTPPRILTASIDFFRLEKQKGDTPTPRFSNRSNVPPLSQVACHLTWTTEQTHEIIQKNIHRSAIYNGNMPSKGPRYCPSIEDKIVRYPDRTRHQIFVEPEGHTSAETFPAAIFTALPYDVQIELMQSIPGFEHCHITQPGYAVEYDIITPTQLYSTLEYKNIQGLWCAGQINGTSGYEEAAAQGLWAAFNIVAKERGLPRFVLGRETSYTAVLIDDLVTLGTDEPYRMFTSRAEYRLLLRESNAPERLTPLGRKYGLVQDTQWSLYEKRAQELATLQTALQKIKLRPDAELRALFEQFEENPPTNTVSLAELIKRPTLDTRIISTLYSEISTYSSDVLDEVITSIRYEGYVTRQQEMANRQQKSEKTLIPINIDYSLIPGLSREVQTKLIQIKPTTLGQAGRISGITPAAISALEIYMVKKAKSKKK